MNPINPCKYNYYSGLVPKDILVQNGTVTKVLNVPCLTSSSNPQPPQFVESVSVEHTGSGVTVTELVDPATSDVVITSKTLISSDGSVVISTNMSGEIDFTTYGGPTPLIGAITTVDASTQLLQTINLTLVDRVYHVWVRVVGRDVSNPIGASFQMNAAFYNNSGTVQQIGSEISSAHSHDTSWKANFSVSGSNALITVNGEAATTIKWKSITLYFVSD